MRILVCISNVPDTTTKVKFGGDNKTLDTSNIQWVINPWDELSLTRALELKDDPSAGVSAVTVAHVGTAAAEPTIRKALAIGADEAVRVNAEPQDAWCTAIQLAEVIRKEKFDLVMCGIESSDYNGSLVGGMIAELLDIPNASAVSSLNIENGKPVMAREIDGGRETLSLTLPCLVVVQKGIAKEPRIASMRGIMTARTKQIRVFEPVAAEPLARISEYEKPQPRAACRFISPDNPAELITLLQKEAKVI